MKYKLYTRVSQFQVFQLLSKKIKVFVICHVIFAPMITKSLRKLSGTKDNCNGKMLFI